MQRKQSSFVWPWCACSTRHECSRHLCWRTIALGKPVVPDEKYIAASSSGSRRLRRAVAEKRAVGHRKRRAVVADVEAVAHGWNAVDYLLDSARELGTEDESRRVGEREAVLYLVSRIAEVQRHGHAARLEDAEVDGQPLEAVHEEYRDLFAALVPSAQKEVREAVRLLVELAPRHLAPERLDGRALDERIFAPGGVAGLKLLRVYLDERDVVRPLRRIALKYLCYVAKVRLHAHFSFAFSFAAFALSAAAFFRSAIASLYSFAESSFGHVLRKRLISRIASAGSASR